MMMQSTIHKFFVALCLSCVPACATPVLWTLSGVTFNDGGTASGSFLYNADTNAFTSINVTTTPGSNFSGAAYIAFSPSHSSTNGGELFFVTASSGNLSNTPSLFLDLSSPMTNGGGTISFITSFVAAGTGDDWFEGQCIGSTCAGGTILRDLTGGEIVSTPEPNSFWPMLLLLGLALFTRFSFDSSTPKRHLHEP